MKYRQFTVFATSVAALGAASPAFAQTDAKPFEGIYVGGSFGYDVQPNDVGSRILFDRNLDGNFNDTVTTAAGANAFSPGFCNGAAIANVPTPGCTNDRDGIDYAGRIGFDVQQGVLVAGIVGEIGKSEVRDSVSAFSTTPASYTMTRKVDYNASLRGRVGYAANTTLFYATGGVAYAKIKSTFTTTNTANAFAGRGKDDRWGVALGGGIEQKLGRNFSIGMEYLYNRFRDNDYRVRATAGSAPATNPFILAPNTTGTDFRRSDRNFAWHSVRAVAAFRF
ncbi:outer membrane protein [uncultured Sphingomonas sp.]|uniref:outer membrane protein n=1 Tax=uncultured Sphingomonas sp. TaxID=158754 RepID=UPI0035C9BF21